MLFNANILSSFKLFNWLYIMFNNFKVTILFFFLVKSDWQKYTKSRICKMSDLIKKKSILEDKPISMTRLYVTTKLNCELLYNILYVSLFTLLYHFNMLCVYSLLFFIFKKCYFLKEIKVLKVIYAEVSNFTIIQNLIFVFSYLFNAHLVLRMFPNMFVN